MSRMTGAEAMVRMLQLHGVKHIFGLCGDTSLPFYAALACLEHGMQHILARDERARLHGRRLRAREPARWACGGGPSGGGATYLLPAREATKSIPVLVIPHQIATLPEAVTPHRTDQKALSDVGQENPRGGSRPDKLPEAVRRASAAMTEAPGSAAPRPALLSAERPAPEAASG